MKNWMISIMLRAFLKASGLIAGSWTVSWCLYRLHGIRLMGPPDEEIWYFAYGANMHDSAFRKMRRMNPSEWRPGLIRGYRLRFNLTAGKAAYANVCSDPGAEVWGVLYKITRRDLVRLEATEGVPWGGYRPHWQASNASNTAFAAFSALCSIDEMNISRSREPSASEPDYSLRKSHAAKLSQAALSGSCNQIAD